MHLEQYDPAAAIPFQVSFKTKAPCGACIVDIDEVVIKVHIE